MCHTNGLRLSSSFLKFLAASLLAGSQFPDKQSNPGPQLWKCRALTTGAPVNAQDIPLKVILCRAWTSMTWGPDGANLKKKKSLILFISEILKMNITYNFKRSCVTYVEVWVNRKLRKNNFCCYSCANKEEIFTRMKSLLAIFGSAFNLPAILRAFHGLSHLYLVVKPSLWCFSLH